MEIEFENLEGKILCFNHAVKAVIEKDETITAHVPDITYDDMGGTGYLGGVCCECFPPELEEEADEDD